MNRTHKKVLRMALINKERPLSTESLTEKEFHVLKKYYIDGLSYREIANEYFVTTKRIRQIEGKAFYKLFKGFRSAWGKYIGQ